MSIFANLPISRKLMAAFAAVIVVIFASSALVYDRLLVIEWVKNWRVHTADVLDTARSPESPVRKYTSNGADIDSVIDVRAIFQQGHRELVIGAMPSFLLPRKGRYGLRDYEKMFCPDLKNPLPRPPGFSRVVGSQVGTIAGRRSATARRRVAHQALVPSALLRVSCSRYGEGRREAKPTTPHRKP